MAKLTKAQASALRHILDHISRGQAFIMSERIAVARRADQATTTAHYVRAQDGACLYELDKEIGSELTLIHNAVEKLNSFIEVNTQQS